MLELIAEMLGYIFVEIIFEGILLRLFRGVKLSGLLALKILTLSNRPLTELEDHYKDSSKPYFLGFGITIGLFYLISYLINF